MIYLLIDIAAIVAASVLFLDVIAGPWTWLSRYIYIRTHRVRIVKMDRVWWVMVGARYVCAKDEFIHQDQRSAVHFSSKEAAEKVAMRIVAHPIRYRWSVMSDRMVRGAEETYTVEESKDR